MVLVVSVYAIQAHIYEEAEDSIRTVLRVATYWYLLRPEMCTDRHKSPHSHRVPNLHILRRVPPPSLSSLLSHWFPPLSPLPLLWYLAHLENPNYRSEHISLSEKMKLRNYHYLLLRSHLCTYIVWSEYECANLPKRYRVEEGCERAWKRSNLLSLNLISVHKST